MTQIEEMKEIIRKSDNIVFFGGAGVSTASGIPDFRSATGLYNRTSNTDYRPEYMLSHEFLVDHPDEFSHYYKENLIYPDAKPNKAHLALAKLERLGKLKAIVTQNIDSLHQMAGNTCVLELHGNLRDYYCVRCGKKYTLDEVLEEKGASHCECGGFIRPDVVLYGEGLDQEVIMRAVEAIRAADVLIVAGTSLVVYPAAGLVNYYRGNKLIMINREPTSGDARADYVLHEDVNEVMDVLTRDL